VTGLVIRFFYSKDGVIYFHSPQPMIRMQSISIKYMIFYSMFVQNINLYIFVTHRCLSGDNMPVAAF